MPKMQYIKHDVLQIYIFKSYVRFQIKEIAKRSLYDDGPSFPTCAPKGAKPQGPFSSPLPLTLTFQGDPLGTPTKSDSLIAC